MSHFFLFKMSNLFLDHSSNAGFVGKYWPSNIHINNVEPVKAAKERELRACRGCQISNGPAVRSQWVWWLRIFLGPNPNIIPSGADGEEGATWDEGVCGGGRGIRREGKGARRRPSLQLRIVWGNKQLPRANQSVTARPAAACSNSGRRRRRFEGSSRGGCGAAAFTSLYGRN